MQCVGIKDAEFRTVTVHVFGKDQQFISMILLTFVCGLQGITQRALETD